MTVSKNQRGLVVKTRRKVLFDGLACGHCGRKTRRLDPPKSQWVACEAGHKAVDKRG